MNEKINKPETHNNNYAVYSSEKAIEHYFSPQATSPKTVLLKGDSTVQPKFGDAATILRTPSQIATANKKLRFGISILTKNSPCRQDYDGALMDALAIKKELELMDMPWQTQKLEIWINKARKKGGYL